MTAASSPDLVAINADDGHRVRCSTLGGDSVGPDDPFATQILDDEDVAVLGPGSGGKERLVRLDGRDGSQLWRRILDADSGEFLGELSPGRLLLGGRERFRLFDSEDVADRPAGTALALVSAGDGRTVWTRPAAAGSDLHVLGTDSGTAVAQDWSTRSGNARLIAIDGAGDLKWSVVPARGDYFDAALLSGRILVRAKDRRSAYAIEDGHRLWTQVLPARPQLLPYGFELDSIPMLDDDHALLGTTTALRTLDLRTGAMTSTATLPRDGINTTYWPYQVAVSAGLIAVATNTGAVVVRRD
jgi:outer membrane protein assembly factor BamB